MDNPGYVTLSRQAGLLKDMRIIANNIANLSTDGFRREGAVFAEMIDRLNVVGGSTAQTAADVRVTDFSQGALTPTGGALDFAIEGDGFFRVEAATGVALTRAGAFTRNEAGELVDFGGRRLLGEGGAPVFAPPDAREVAVATDGTLSADGQAIGRIELVTVEDASGLRRGADGLFTTDQPLIPAETASLFQGFREQSNVDPIREIARMIDVQRAYEMGQKFLSTEDERMRQVVRVIGAAV
ncbi:flagellar hook-basal body complex protein [Pikeienuella piscinae]|uniref:Flagellar basal-body rod protein FlgF n=1 Tax=Pikeienuella piscinae TaxID=2748098 RepID=A0A7L5BZR1_9RHOB|nr:flagellar hook-basal body complex protein [Pikeienuella piscinae]QIE56971.1 flagellar hook-basal body complex protein [Pikeienuella piscinae]